MWYLLFIWDFIVHKGFLYLFGIFGFIWVYGIFVRGERDGENLHITFSKEEPSENKKTRGLTPYPEDQKDP